MRVVAGANAADEKARMVDVAPPDLAAGSGAATTNYRYCEFASDASARTEYFDYAVDPYELVNGADALAPARRAALSARLAALNSCRGAVQCTPLLTTLV